MPTPSALATEKTVAVLIAPGLEEVEALAVVDCLYRAGVRADLIAVADDPVVESSHGVRLVADLLLADADLESYDVLFLPGGMPGTLALEANSTIAAELDRRSDAGLAVAAICAAPSILAKRGHLVGRLATSNPGFLHVLEEHGALVSEERAVVDGEILTSRGAGTALDLGIALVEHLLDEDTAARVSAALVR